jgi:hypothetical protein
MSQAHQAINKLREIERAWPELARTKSNGAEYHTLVNTIRTLG